jgi:hypothetical protein
MESPATAARPQVELIVLNGRLKGNRRPLNGPLTLFGQDPTCDIRLNLDGIAFLHAALVIGPAGPIVRSLSSASPVQVNGVVSDNRLLQDGDILTVGPFQFQVCVPHGMGFDDAGLRVQAAAVAAEQVRLFELESKLEQRRLALTTREEQLVAHLEEKRTRLERLQQQVKTERDQYAQQREAEENQLAAQRTLLATQRAEFEEEARRLAQERQTLQERLEAQIRAREVAIDQRERELDAQDLSLERERARQLKEREAVDRMRLRVNTDLELGKRQLQEEREALHLAQQEWEVVLNTEAGERQRKLREVGEAEKALATAREQLAKEQRQWRTELVHLQKDATGLESRIAGQRQRMLAVERELSQGETLLRGRPVHLHAPVVPQATPLELPPAPPELRDLEALIADQRLHLAEQWLRLTQQQQRWEEDRTTVQRDLEALSTQLLQREQALAPRETELNEKAASLARLAEVLEQRQTRLEGFESRLRVQEIEQLVVQERARAAVAIREQAVVDQIQIAQDVVQRERERTRRRLRKLAHARKRLEGLHTQYVALWHQQQEARRTALVLKQTLARKELALEKLRDEILSRAANAPAAERRLDRLEREYVDLWAREEADLKIEWQALDREREMLENLAQQGLTQSGSGLVRVAWAQRLRIRAAERRAEIERRLAGDRARLQHLELELTCAETRAGSLQAELERVALNLLGEVGSTPEPLAVESQAA